MEENIANSIDTTIENAEANSQEQVQGTQENENSTNTLSEVEQIIDYQKRVSELEDKFSNSAREAQRLYEENKRMKAELELKDTSVQETVQSTDNLYPGFENLDEESQANLRAYSNAITSKASKDVEERIKSNPAIAFAMKQYADNRFNGALEKTIEKYPELAESKEEFKAKYYNPANVPENIESILGDLAKIHLFDKAKTIGEKEAEEKSKRFDLERNTSGTRETTVKRSLDDWNRMARENPVKFAKLANEFDEDMKSGRI